MNKYLTYIQQFQENNEAGIYFVNNQLKKHLETNEENQTEIEHILDYLYSTGKKFKIGYKTIAEKARKWNENLQKVAIKDNEKDGVDYEVLKDWGDGFKMVKLISKSAYEREGKLMSHCVASYFGRDVEIYSLRDNKNLPHCTIEKDVQIKGKGNGEISPKYIKYVVEFLEEIGMEVRDSEMKNLGYVNIDNINDKNAVFPDLFRNKYFYKENLDKIVDKNGKRYENITLWRMFGLFKFSSKLEVKFNFDIRKSIDTFMSFLSLSKKVKAGGDKAQLAGGYYAQLAGGDKAQLAGGYKAQLAGGDKAQLAGGDKAQLAGGYKAQLAGGDKAQLAGGDKAQLAGGYYAQLAGGYYAQLAGGDCAQLAGGDCAQLAGGYYAQLAGGYYAQLAGGDYAQLAGGDYAQLAGGDKAQLAGGDKAQLALNGKNSLGVAGYKSIIKGKISSAFALGVYDDNYNIVGIKAVLIDGKKYKEDTFYCVKDGNIVEWYEGIFD